MNHSVYFSLLLMIVTRYRVYYVSPLHCVQTVLGKVMICNIVKSKEKSKKMLKNEIHAQTIGNLMLSPFLANSIIIITAIYLLFHHHLYFI